MGLAGGMTLVGLLLSAASGKQLGFKGYKSYKMM
jgi:hypothetical protein